VTIDVTANSSTSARFFVPGTAGGAINPNCIGCAPYGGPAGKPPVETGLFLNADSTVTINAAGVVTYCGVGCSSGPNGDPAAYVRPDFLVQDMIGIALIARIGTGPWQFVGSGPTTLTASQAGTVQLAINDSYYADNAGGYTADVVVNGPAVDSLAAGLVSRWQADGTAADSVGANAGTLMNGAGYATSQPSLGQAFSFTPTTVSPNQYVLIGNQPSLVASNAVTMAAWIYPTGPGYYSTTFSSPNDPPAMGEGGMVVNQEDSYEFARFADGTIRWAFNTGSPGWTWINSFAVAPEHQWTHVVVTYDSAAGVARTYLNGVLAHTYSVSGQIVDAGKQFRLGGRQNSDTNSIYQNFDGLIDSVALYTRALSAGEAQALFYRRY
jgi:hypothetical protein